MSKTEIDPYNIEALEKSLNDSATRVSTIWVSFVIFSLYLLVAATTVDDRQLLLADPVKLPVLGIELPLRGFFILAPILFVIFHTYVLIQVILLARTAAVYNDVLDRLVPLKSNNTVMRQRLANTLFAQIFAGSPRERQGWLGLLLKGIAWITLAVAPVLLLLSFQFAFLPYHDHLATWVHRLLILAELVAVVGLWTPILDARREVGWSKIKDWLRGLLALFATLVAWASRTFTSKRRVFASPKRRWCRQCSRMGRRVALPIALVALYVTVSLSVASFPGELHVNLATGHPPRSTQCERWFAKTYDRLILRNVDVVDDEKLAKIIRATEERMKENAHEGEATRNFRDRDLSCADLSNADFRHVDLQKASLSGANLNDTELQGATLDNAHLSEATLRYAKLSGASLKRAEFHNADLTGAELTEVHAEGAGFQDADLSYSHLRGAYLRDTLFHAANLSSAQLQGASLWGTEFQAANLESAEFQSASLYLVKFQGATLTQANLTGARMTEVQLQGAVMEGAILETTLMARPYVWRTTGASCNGAQIENVEPDAIIDVNRSGLDSSVTATRATPRSVKNFISRIVQKRPESQQAQTRELLEARLQKEMEPEASKSANWEVCASQALSTEEYYQKMAKRVLEQVCSKAWNPYLGANAIVAGAVSMDIAIGAPPSYTKGLARGLLGIDKTVCTTPIELPEKTKLRLTRWLMQPESDQ